jgi:thiamine-phosphate pyrophosphorylase
VLVQLRDRELTYAERRSLGENLRGLTRRHGQSLAVNDRLDLAALLGADAVHLAESSVTPEDARAFAAQLGMRWFVSAACHAPEQLASGTADALLLAPVAEPRKGRPALGVAGLEAALRARAARNPALGRCRLHALGGVTHHNAAALCAAGADGVAVIGELFDAAALDPLLAALDIAR